jgi:hypothetical protein
MVSALLAAVQSRGSKRCIYGHVNLCQKSCSCGFWSKHRETAISRAQVIDRTALSPTFGDGYRNAGTKSNLAVALTGKPSRPLNEHTPIPAPLRAAERKSKIRAEEIGDYSSFSPRGLLPESLMILRTVEQVRRLSRIVGGFTLLLIGIVMLVTPGPGWLVILLGLGLLAAEFVWARRLMDRIKHEGQRMRSVVWRTTKNAPAKDSAESNETT